jgi:hypothetical protein
MTNVSFPHWQGKNAGLDPGDYPRNLQQDQQLDFCRRGPGSPASKMVEDARTRPNAG